MTLHFNVLVTIPCHTHSLKFCLVFAKQRTLPTSLIVVLGCSGPGVCVKMTLTLYATPCPFHKHSVALAQEVSPCLSWCFCSSVTSVCCGVTAEEEPGT